MNQANKLPLSAVLIVKNEEQKLENCLRSLSFVDEIVVIDSGSHDKTCEIAKKFTDKVFFHEFTDFSSQKNYAKQKASHDWILSIDADERVDEDLRSSIMKAIQSNQTVNAYRMRRKSIIFGKVFKFSGTQNDSPIRLFKKSQARFDQKIHEVLIVSGKVGQLEGCLHHHTFQTTKDYVRRLNHYTDLEVEHVRESIPLSVNQIMCKGMARFFYQYVFRLGLFDGKEGFYYCWLSAWYQMLKGLKIHEKNEFKTA